MAVHRDNDLGLGHPDACQTSPDEAELFRGAVDPYGCANEDGVHVVL